MRTINNDLCTEYSIFRMLLSFPLAAANDLHFLNISFSKNVFHNVGFRLFFALNISIITSCILCIFTHAKNHHILKLLPNEGSFIVKEVYIKENSACRLWHFQQLLCVIDL